MKISKSDDRRDSDRTHHPFKWLKFDGEKVRIDKEIAPLLSNLWKLGIRTTNSCQEHCSFNCKHKYKKSYDEDGCLCSYIIPTKKCWDSIWLCFEQASDLEKFYNIIAKYGSTDYDVVSSWPIRHHIINYGIEGCFTRPIINGKRSTVPLFKETSCRKNNFIVSPQLTFPRKYLSFIEDKINT